MHPSSRSLPTAPSRSSAAYRRPPRDDRGDVPGWVLITVMTAGLVSALWIVADEQLARLFAQRARCGHRAVSARSTATGRRAVEFALVSVAGAGAVPRGAAARLRAPRAQHAARRGRRRRAVRRGCRAATRADAAARTRELVAARARADASPTTCRAARGVDRRRADGRGRGARRRCRCSGRGARPARCDVAGPRVRRRTSVTRARTATTTASAIVEFVLLAVVLLVPFAYAVLARLRGASARPSR